MRCKAFFFAIFTLHFIAQANIEDKIQTTQVKIDTKQSLQKRLSNRLEKIANDINHRYQKINRLSDEIKKCKLEIKELQKKSKIKKGELLKLQKLYNKLEKKEKLIGGKVVDIISKELSIDIITHNNENENDLTQEDIVMNEILHNYTDILRKNLKRNKSKYIKYNKSIDIVKKEVLKYANRKKALELKQKTLLNLNKTQQASIASLKKQKEEYIKRLNQIKNEKNALAKTLNRLHITKKKLQQTTIKATGSNVNVRQIGSSYQHTKLIKYRGPKTISPLKSYTLVQNFGNYVDPIYKIKIFNDAVILRSKKRDAKVYNVLDGTVIYADKTPMLDRVVIVKNKNNIHTIYAHLSKIAPTVHVGKRLKKGYVLGRINKELTFEVTQNEKHINPMRLIK
ncbi:MAG: hypothetical protein DSZ06_02125 [Sulfurospirillum sp.]|nr:MAG: hypothetical protein DSZ06_02125 [Sulfurospirillum sp.]